MPHHAARAALRPVTPGGLNVWSIVLDILHSRTGRVAAQVAVLTAVVGGAFAYAHSDKNVTLVIDGASSTVDSSVDTVGALLADKGISVSSRDIVAPAPGSSLKDGEHVVVRYARPLDLKIDGMHRTYWTTELTVADALAGLGIRADGARLSVSRSQPLGRAGLGLTVSTPKTVTLAADGRTRRLSTTASTVTDFLAEQGLTVRPADRLSVAPGTPVVPGLAVAVTRVDHRQVTATEPVPNATDRRDLPKLDKGEQKVITAGAPGAQTVTYDLVLTDGKVTAKNVVSATVIEKPVDRVLGIGSKAPVAGSTATGGSGSTGSSAGGSVAGADGLNWSALAQCESGGNPQAVNPAGYYGLYQFSTSTWRGVGGSGLPSNASAAEQLSRAKILFSRTGASSWGCGRHLYD